MSLHAVGVTQPAVLGMNSCNFSTGEADRVPAVLGERLSEHSGGEIQGYVHESQPSTSLEDLKIHEVSYRADGRPKDTN